MPSVRRSTGRAVTPVRQPEVAAVKRTQLTPPAVVAFPLPAVLRLEAETAPILLARGLELPDLPRPPLTSLAPPQVAPTTARLDLDAPPENLPVRFWPVETQGLQWPPSGRPDEGGQQAEFPDVADLRAILSPDLFEQEAEHVAFPSPPRPDQLETVRRLVEGGDWLLAHDPGIGLEETVCLALRELFRSRQARRAVLIVPQPMQRAWRARLQTWGPAVDVRGGSDGATAAEDGAAYLRLLDFPATVETSPDAVGEIDVLVVDSYAALRRRGGDPTTLSRFSSRRRWVLSGGPPQEAEDWRLLHRFFHPRWGGTASLADIHERLRDRTIRQTRTALAEQLPRRSRQEIWFDLDREQRAAYETTLKDERSRLARMGGAVNRTQVEGSLKRLKQALAFLPGSLDGVKVRALVDLTEEILASGAKLLVVTPPEETILAGLVAVLEAHGGVRLDSRAPSDEQAGVLEAFRRPSGPRILVVDTDARGDGEPLDGATYLIHFSHEWNPAHRRRAEQRMFPDLGPGPPHTVIELWVADTVEETYHTLLEAQGLLASAVDHATRPSELEERLTLGDWLHAVFDITGAGGGMKKPVTGRLPGTGALREVWQGFSPESLGQAAEALMRALGFTQVEPLGAVQPWGRDFAAWQATEGGAERSFIRCLRTDAPADVAQLREAREEMARHPDCVGCLLITTAEVTAAAREMAEASGGSLALVDGHEFYRHLRVLGLLG